MENQTPSPSTQSTPWQPPEPVQFGFEHYDSETPDPVVTPSVPATPPTAQGWGAAETPRFGDLEAASLKAAAAIPTQRKATEDLADFEEELAHDGLESEAIPTTHTPPPEPMPLPVTAPVWVEPEPETATLTPLVIPDYLSSEDGYRLAALTRKIAQYPEHPMNYVLRGELLLIIGNDEKAAADFQTAVQLCEKMDSELDWGYINAAALDRAQKGLRQIFP